MILYVVGSRDLAIKYLTKAKWELEMACNNFWEYPPSESELQPVVDTEAVSKEFRKYAGAFNAFDAI